MVDAVLESLLKRDRLIVLTGLFVIGLIAWVYLATLTHQMNMANTMETMVDMPGMAPLRAWTTSDAWLMFGMWVTMMTAMMAPSVTPVVLLYARVCRGRNNERGPYAPTGAFFLGYLAVWFGFSAALTALQWGLEQTALLSPQMMSISPWFGGLTLIAAGLYQWLPVKNACLGHCRAPVQFLATRWQPGVGGAFRMGLAHGLYCLGCCWALMILLFVGGVMNLLWVAALAIFVLLEKVAPFGRTVSRIGALVFMAAGVLTILNQ